MNIQHFNPAHPFWRATPLSPPETELLGLVFAAHAASVARDNVSSVTLINAFCGSGRYPSALAAALCTLGGPHGPIEETWDLLRSSDPCRPIIDYYLTQGRKVPGWGNSFIKFHHDELWTAVHEHLSGEMALKIDHITNFLHSRGKDIYPNPSAYTAAAALTVGLPRALAPWLFIAGRLTAWTERLAQL